MRHREVRLVFAAVGLVVLTSSACGSASPSGPIAAPANCSSPDPGVSKTTVQVGAILPQSGPDASLFADAEAGIRARFSVENAAGGVGGRKLVLHTADDGDGEQENLSAAHYLVSAQHVFGLIEVSGNSDGGGAYLNQLGIPVTGWAITPNWGQYRNMFGYHYSTPPNAAGQPVTLNASFAKAHGAKRVAVLAGGNTESVDFVTQFSATLHAFGLTLAYQNLHEQVGQTDFSFDAVAMARAGVDTVLTGLAPLANVAVLQAARTAGVPLKVVLLPAGYDARYAAAFASVLEGAYVAIDWRPFELPVPAHQTFEQALHTVSPATFPGQLAMVGWLSADTFIRGLAAAGARCPTRSAFVHNLRLVRGYTADGLVPPTNFTTIFGKMPLCYWMLQIHSGRFVPVSDKPLCGRLLSEVHR
jgi:ABC-type branched-subunit amino acid transport system substrate-binding protein